MDGAGFSLQFMLFMSTVITWKICACVPRRTNSAVGKETVAFSLLVVAIGFIPLNLSIQIVHTSPKHPKCMVVSALSSRLNKACDTI